MATAQSVIVTLNTNTLASLPDNRMMRYGVNYVISVEDYAKISSSSVITLVNGAPANTVVPLWDGTDYALNLSTIHNIAALTNVRIADGNLPAASEKVFKLGEVVSGFGEDLFMLVKLTGTEAVAATTTKNVALWYGDRENHEVSVNTSADAGEFAGVLIGAVTAGRYGWVQISGNVAAAAANAIVKTGDAVVVNTGTDGQFTDVAKDEVQIITLTGFDTAGDEFALTYDGTESALFVHGTNAASTDLQSELRTLTGNSSLTVSGNVNAGPYTVTFVGGEGNELPITVTNGNAAVNAVQTLTLSGGAENDTINLRFNSHTGTVPITMPSGGYANVAAADVKAALLSISDWTTKTADIAVAKATNDYAITFTGTLGAQPIGAITTTGATGAAAGSVDPVTAVGNEATTGVVVESVKGGTSAGGTIVGTALTDSAATLAEIKLNKLTPTGNHKRRRNLFFDK